MAAGIVVFGATGYTGRMVAEQLVARGERPVLAARSAQRLQALAGALGGLETRVADVTRPGSVLAVVAEGDVLVSTVGPFARHGGPAVRAAIAAGGVYLDSTGEPAFIRRVFEELGPAAGRAGAALLPAMGYEFVPGALAGALALEDAGEAAVRVDLGYYALGARPGTLSAGTKQSALGVALDPSFTFRGGRLRTARTAAQVRSFPVAGGERPAVSVGGAEHFGLPAAYPRLREVNVYLGGMGPLARPLQAVVAATAPLVRVGAVREALRSVGERAMRMTGDGDPGGSSDSRSWVAAEAFDAAGERLAAVGLSGPDVYVFTGAVLAWGAARAARRGVEGTGALGPVGAFGLAELEAGCREAGLERVSGASWAQPR